MSTGHCDRMKKKEVNDAKPQSDGYNSLIKGSKNEAQTRGKSQQMHLKIRCDMRAEIC